MAGGRVRILKFFGPCCKSFQSGLVQNFVVWQRVNVNCGVLRKILFPKEESAPFKQVVLDNNILKSVVFQMKISSFQLQVENTESFQFMTQTFPFIVICLPFSHNNSKLSMNLWRRLYTTLWKKVTSIFSFSPSVFRLFTENPHDLICMFKW